MFLSLLSIFTDCDANHSKTITAITRLDARHFAFYSARKKYKQPVLGHPTNKIYIYIICRKSIYIPKKAKQKTRHENIANETCHMKTLQEAEPNRQ